jgi:hypothetical protein
VYTTRLTWLSREREPSPCFFFCIYHEGSSFSRCCLTLMVTALLSLSVPSVSCWPEKSLEQNKWWQMLLVRMHQWAWFPTSGCGTQLTSSG